MNLCLKSGKSYFTSRSPHTLGQKSTKLLKCRQSDSFCQNCVYTCTRAQPSTHTHSPCFHKSMTMRNDTIFHNFLQIAACLSTALSKNDEVHQYFSVLLSFGMFSNSLASPCLDAWLKIGDRVSASTRISSQMHSRLL